MNIKQIARHYGGKVCNGNALIPTPGHSSRDRGTAIKPCASAPDGVLVACYNGTTADALAVKAMLRRDGFLPAENERKLSPSERRSILWAELAHERRRLKAEADAERIARTLWANAGEASRKHPYLVSKRLEPFGIRQERDALLVPMVDATFRLRNLQRIKPDGFKLFVKDARTAGLFWPHAIHCADGGASPGPLVIGEGFATMAAIHEATGYGVCAALTNSYLETVAKTMRQLFPARSIIIAADDDRHLAENKGLKAARMAAGAVSGLLAVPRPECSIDRAGLDFADLTRSEAASRIAAAIEGEARA